MALGGGMFLTQNKVLPGAYINFISASRASATLTDRGYAALAVELDWGEDDKIFAVTPEDLQKDSKVLFGYAYTHEKLKGLRDLFKNIKVAYLYRLNTGAKAENEYATAKYSGIRGNELKIVIVANIDDNTAFDVKTLFDNAEVDVQTVKTVAELKANKYVDWKKGPTLTATAGTTLAGGSNKATVTGDDYQTFLDKIESYSFNALGCVSTEKVICDLFVQFTKRMRDQVGAKFQTVLYRTEADYEGVVSVENKTLDEGWPVSSAVYWTLGAAAGCPVNKTNLNKKYDGEFTIDVEFKQSQLETGLKTGKFMFHKMGDEVRVLDDINTFVSFVVDKNEDFSSNQTMRVLDQIANDIALLFNTRHLGNTPNDDSGRIAFWSDIVKHHQELQKLRAIENFKSEDITVIKGDAKKAVIVSDRVTPVNAMAQLYMTVVVS